MLTFVKQPHPAVDDVYVLVDQDSNSVNNPSVITAAQSPLIVLIPQCKASNLSVAVYPSANSSAEVYTSPDYIPHIRSNLPSVQWDLWPDGAASVNASDINDGAVSALKFVVVGTVNIRVTLK